MKTSLAPTSGDALKTRKASEVARMSDTSNRQPVGVTPKRGEAAWRAAKEEVASRNERAYKLGRERRQKEYDQYAARRRAADARERAELAKRRP
jgi:hypothetical protein